MSIVPTLLCVEDDPGVREFYERLFGAHGYEVILAESVSEALECFTGHSVEAVITDYTLPGGDGATLAKRLKELNPQVPVLMISGSYPSDYEPPEGVDVVLAKGVSNREMLQRLDRLILTRASESAREYQPADSVAP